MGKITLELESALVEEILKSEHYKAVQERHFAHKTAREEEAWKMVQEYRGKYTYEVLRAIFDKVDIDTRGGHWFGLMLSKPNVNRIFHSPLQLLNQWMDKLLFSDQTVESRLDCCMNDMRINGASKGLATLLLYLSSQMQFNIWVNATEEGLVVLGRVGELTGRDWGADYQRFNKAAIAFRDANRLKAREVDWFLSYIRKYVESDDNHFCIDEDALGATSETVVVDDVGELIDFNPHNYADLPATPGIYVLYDVSERPIYVGQASDIRSRIGSHNEKFWFKDPIVHTAAYVTIEDKVLRKKIETLLIRFLKSNAVLNKQNVDR